MTPVGITVWLAQTGDGVDPAVFAQYGVLGIFAVLLTAFARVAWKRETERADRLEAENQRLNAILREQAIPALTTAVAVMQESQELLRDLQRDLRDRRHRNGETT